MIAPSTILVGAIIYSLTVVQTLKLISYNIEKHKAVKELSSLIKATRATSICIQEAKTESLPKNIEGLELVASTPQNRLGLAIYADLKSYQLIDVFTKGFKKTLHDRIAAPANDRLLGAVLSHKETGQLSVLASFHASPLTSLNKHRRQQIQESLQAIDKIAPDSPFIMAGDYNYPLFRQGLNKSLKDAGYDVTFSNSGTYQKSIFRGHFDFITSRGYSIESVNTLPQGSSDHLPILISSKPQKIQSLHTKTLTLPTTVAV